jgi:sulfide:quinone oxidoreductase
VYAIGDVIEIRLANGLPLPKAGLFAERQGAHVAATIAAEVAGTPAPPPYSGTGHCYIEAGKTIATKVEGDFFAEPEPRITILGPSEATAREKHEWEADRLTYWFGS